MTVRDCTLFILVPCHLISDPKALFHGPSSSVNGSGTNPHQSVTVEDFPGSGKIRILVSDLDEKSEKHRGEYWRSLEEQLINGGYYLGKGKMDVNAENCDFSDNATTSDQVKWDGCTMSGCDVDAYLAGNRESNGGAPLGTTLKRRSNPLVTNGASSVAAEDHRVDRVSNIITEEVVSGNWH